MASGGSERDALIEACAKGIHHERERRYTSCTYRPWDVMLDTAKRKILVEAAELLEGRDSRG